MKDNITRGEIYFADLDPAIGHEQSGLRPVLIIQNPGNRHSPTTIIAPITSAPKQALPTHVHIEHTGDLPLDSLIMCEQIRTLDKSRLSDRITSLDRALMRKVDRAVCVSLAIVPQSREDKMEMCLCHPCSQQFYESPSHYIERADPTQVEKHRCDWCGVRTGFDYVIRRKSYGR
jgi:mRNA interferase MazF